MKNKLTMLLLALVIALGGTSVAMLGACDGCKDNPPPGPTEKDEYTVKFVDEKGAEIDSVTVTSGAGYRARGSRKGGIHRQMGGRGRQRRGLYAGRDGGRDVYGEVYGEHGHGVHRRILL